MADVTLTVYETTRAISGAANLTDNDTAATSSDTYYIPNNGRVALYAKAGSTANLTIQTPNTIDGNAIADLVIALPDTDMYLFGPFPPGVYNDSQGRLVVTVSANTDLMAIRVP